MDKSKKDDEADFEPIENPKSFKQILLESPQQKGGLAQLAQMEEAGVLFSSKRPTKH